MGFGRFLFLLLLPSWHVQLWGGVLYQWHTLESSTHAWSKSSLILCQQPLFWRQECMYKYGLPQGPQVLSSFDTSRQPHWPYQNLYLVTWWASACIEVMFTDRFIQSKAFVFSSHILLPLLKGGQNKASILLSQTLQNSCGVFIHQFAPQMICNQVFFSKKLYKNGGLSPDFSLRAKFKLEKNEKKNQKNLLIFNVCQRWKKIKISQFQE